MIIYNNSLQKITLHPKLAKINKFNNFIKCVLGHTPVAALGCLIRGGNFFSGAPHFSLWGASMGRLYRAPLAAPIGAAKGTPVGRLCR